MTLDELRTKHKADIERITSQYGIANIRVFGSTVRGDAGPDSDVDLLVTLTQPIGWGYAGCQIELEEALQMKVDLISDRGLSPRIGPYILKEAVPL